MGLLRGHRLFQPANANDQTSVKPVSKRCITGAGARLTSLPAKRIDLSISQALQSSTASSGRRQLSYLADLFSRFESMYGEVVRRLGLCAVWREDNRRSWRHGQIVVGARDADCG